MRISYKLLKEYGNINATKEEVVSLIEKHICEVEGYRDLAEDYKGIVVAQIVSKKDHPNSQKLGVYEVITEENGEKIQVCAGDKKLNVGDKVAFLTVGSKVPCTIETEPEPVVIQKASLGGEESNGMMGSQRELNIGTDNTGVYVLPEDATVGTPFAEYYGLDDLVIDIENKEITNRGDLFGLIGVSRELTAVTGNKFVSPDWFLDRVNDIKPETESLNLSVTNDAEVLCPRYMAVAMSNVEIKESPIWLKSILIKEDIKPINNIVDITNYVALLFGQPMHAFDYDKVIANDDTTEDCANIVIRTAKEGESILCLDGKEHDLSNKTIVIANNTKPMAIGGIIGGIDTEIDNNTKNIIFEAANFDKTSIRKSSMELGINTDSSTINKHALDPENTLPAIKYAIKLAKELANAQISSNAVDIYETKATQQTITLDIPRLNSHIGTELDKDTIKTILENLEYSVKDGKEDTLIVTAPSWRKDVEISEDIHEDIARIYGYGNLNMVLPKKRIVPAEENKVFETKKKIRNILAFNGANETLTYSFTSLDNFKACNLDADLAYKIKNPLSPDLSLMRTTLLQSLLQKAKENIQRNFSKFALFEMNIAHLNNYIDQDTNLPKEEWFLSMVIVNTKKQDTSGNPYYMSKLYLEKILNGLGYTNNLTYTLCADAIEQELDAHIKNKMSLLDANSSAIVSVCGVTIGVIGNIKQSIKNNFKLPEYTCVLDISVDRLTEIEQGVNTYRETSVYPPFSVDLCFEMDKSITYETIYNELYSIINRGDLNGKVECLDIYQDKDNSSRKRITYRISASSYNKTLTDKEISSVVNKIKGAIEHKYSVILK
ncbi:phenylalanine--tRNA ligase subunit beta [bacterium]|nr:phenylalanine--tRNA ligase subunit beta [bacterium]